MPLHVTTKIRCLPIEDTIFVVTVGKRLWRAWGGGGGGGGGGALISRVRGSFRDPGAPIPVLLFSMLHCIREHPAIEFLGADNLGGLVGL